LAKEPNDVNSLKQTAAIYFSIKKFDEAKDFQKKVLAADPKDPEAAYTIGVIDWTLAHENTLKLLATVNMNDDGEGNSKAPKKVLEEIKRLLAKAKEFVEKGRSAQTDRSKQYAWPHPVIANGKLYLRDQDVLLCYNLAATTN
jgi:tetratricopeptide (TPR) repeat protein